MANTIRSKATVNQNTQSRVIGITAPVPMGDWQANTQYLKLNIVRYNGASYIAKKQSTGVEPTITTGWQEVWQSVAYDGLVTPIGNYPDMSVGKATQADNDGTGKNIADQFSAIDEVIPSTASENNQLADKAFVNSSINAMAAFYITYNSQGDAFPTRAALLSATIFYSGGEVRVPTQNDYVIVRTDESQPQSVDGSYPTTRYSYQGGTYPNGQWDFQYVVNNTSLTQAQVDAINSGITKELVETIGKGNVLSVNGETGAVTITPESIGAVNKSGDTMTGMLNIIRGASGNTGMSAARTDTNNELLLGIGSGGENRGMYDSRLNKWIAHCNNTDVFINNINTKYLLYTDPTKLEPTTANGWTVGTSTLKLPSAGMYLVSINSMSPSLIIYDGAESRTFYLNGTLDLYLISYGKVGETWYWIGLNEISVSSTSPHNLVAAIKTTTSVAYKKLA